MLFYQHTKFDIPARQELIKKQFNPLNFKWRELSVKTEAGLTSLVISQSRAEPRSKN